MNQVEGAQTAEAQQRTTGRNVAIIISLLLVAILFSCYRHRQDGELNEIRTYLDGPVFPNADPALPDVRVSLSIGHHMITVDSSQPPKPVTNGIFCSRLYDRLDERFSLYMNDKQIKRATKETLLHPKDANQEIEVYQTSFAPHYSRNFFEDLDSVDQTLNMEINPFSGKHQQGSINFHWHRLGKSLTIDRINITTPQNRRSRYSFPSNPAFWRHKTSPSPVGVETQTP